MQASISSFLNKRKMNRDVFYRRLTVATIPGIFVIVAVFWWLKLTGITMAGEACCGFIEHEHSEECVVRTLICEYDEAVENEDKGNTIGIYTTAYAAESENAEALADTDGAVAEDTVQDVSSETHSLSAEYDENTAGQDNKTDETVIPEELTDEAEAVDITENNETLGNPESEEIESVTHFHTDECYQLTYYCGLEEHIHDFSCYSNAVADVETPSIWESTFADIEITTDLSKNLIAIAKTQLGYEESTQNYQIDAEKEKHGYTRYGDWYGNPYNKWSAIFVQFCLYYSGTDGDSIDYYAGIERLRSVWEDNGILTTPDEHIPIPGDIVFLDYDGDEKADYAGIISEETDDEYTIIVGDYENKVSEITIEKEDERIVSVTIAEKLLENIADEQTLEVVDYVNNTINSFPSFEEIAMEISNLETNGDQDLLAEYLNNIGTETYKIYNLYRDLGMFGKLILNSDRLLEYSSLWLMDMSVESEITIHHVNNYHYKNDVPGNILIHSGTVRQHTLGMSFRLCSVYIIDGDESGYYIKEAHPADDVTDWRDTRAPDGGFILILNKNAGQVWGVEVGDRVEVDFAYLDADGYNANGFGSVGIITSNNLTPIQSADTAEFIELDFFNYDDKINTKYDLNNNYPGFQQGKGTTTIGTALTVGSFNFGDNITVDYDAGKSGVGNGVGAINKVPDGNTPVQGAMNYNLVNGYPSLAHTDSEFNPSLSWLFTDNPANGVNKVNSSNVNGLFRYDEDKGFYYFDSRLNHAQYNKSTGNVDLYAEHLTPNFMMYPFGNFLPFNDINLQSTKVTSINKAYFNAQADRAEAKYNYTRRAEYQTLKDVLTTFSARMGNSFTYQDAANKYFSLVSQLPASVPSEAFNGMYNLDYSEPSDFYFGMHMHMNFMMTKDGTTGANKTPLYFDFNGDDDIWIYVDNKLFLDLSGIHRHVGGRIDFQHGRVYYFAFNPATGQADLSVDTKITDANGNKYIDENGRYYVPFSVFLGPTAEGLINPETGTFYPYTNHPFDLFYMERGSGSSVCSMEFTIPLLQKNSITVTKEMTSEDNLDVLGNPDFAFQILKPDKTTPFIGEGVTYSILDANTQKEIGKGITKANGVFTLKAEQTAVFSGINENAGNYFVRELLDTTVFEQYGTVTVDGKSTTTDHYTDIAIGTGSFKGVDSDIKNISDGSTAFAFTNHIDITKYGALSLEKRYNEYQSGVNPQTVTLEVLMGGEPIASGSEYTVIDSKGIYTVKQVTTKGRISFRSDERVLFPKLLAGTKVTVRETPESSAGYDVSYTTIKDFTITTYQDEQGIYCEGTIPAKNPLPITVHNERSGKKLTIRASKSLLHPDGTEHTYSFILERILSLTDHTTDGFYIRTPVSLTDGTENFEFTLNYPPGTASGKYYYLIREEDANRQNGMDLKRYIAEVTVSNSGGTTNAELTGYYSEDGTPLTSQDISFENRVVRTLTIGKTVQGIQTSDAFTFEIRAFIDEMPLSGTFYYADDTVAEIGELTFENGVATVSLTHGKLITVYGLPYGTDWTVTEINTSGFFAKYIIDNSDIVNGNEGTGTLLADSSIHFYNVGGYELPSTGSSAYLWFIIMGLALMLISLIIGYLMRRRAERRLR